MTYYQSRKEQLCAMLYFLCDASQLQNRKRHNNNPLLDNDNVNLMNQNINPDEPWKIMILDKPCAEILFPIV